MRVVHRGEELSILSSSSAPTDGSNAEPPNPDSSHRPRSEDVAPCIRASPVPTSSVEAGVLRAGGLQADEDPVRGSGDPKTERGVGSITPSSWPRA